MRLIDHLHKGSARDPARAALVDGGQVTTWRDMTESYERMAATLISAGVAPGQRIGVLSPNTAAAFTAMLAIIRMGGVWVPINARNTAFANRNWIALTGCQVLYYAAALKQEALVLQTVMRPPSLLICLDDNASLGRLASPAITRGQSAPAAWPGGNLEATVNLFPTGGTTGLSKAVRWNSRTWNALLRAYYHCMPSTEPPCHLVAAPLTHAAGVMALACLPAGGTNVILPDANPKHILDAIEQWRITHLYLPPTVVYKLLTEPDLRKRDFASLRYLLIAASPIAPAKLREAIDVFGSAICQSFGQAEAPMFITFLSNRDLRAGPDSRLSSCGRATDVAEVAIMDEGGSLLSSGARGEIVVRGELVAPGYLDNPPADAEARAHGWHHTGDVGYVDDDGFVHIVDRLKDMIITGGFNVYSAEVEQVILEHPAVMDCAVIGVPDPIWGEAIKAVVELKFGASAESEELIGMVKRRLGSVHAPKTVEIWPTLPRSPAGKVLKKQVREKYWARSQRQVG